MGQPVKIAELAEKLIHLSGLSVRSEKCPHGDIAIEYTGLRPGEKLYEELLIGDNVSPTEHPMIMRANEEHLDWDVLRTGWRNCSRRWKAMTTRRCGSASRSGERVCAGR